LHSRATRSDNDYVAARTSRLDDAARSVPLYPRAVKRDSFEQAVGIDQKASMSIGGSLAAPATALQFD
jgi:hypothetical protein